MSKSRAYTRQEIIEELLRCDQEVDGVLTAPEFSEMSYISAGTVQNRFGSWNKAKEKLGLELSDRPGRNSKGGRPAYRDKALEAKGRECDVCGGTDGIIVHHINQDRTDNRLKNLLPVCGTCHAKIHNHKSYNEQLDRLTDQLQMLPLVRDESKRWENQDKHI